MDVSTGFLNTIPKENFKSNSPKTKVHILKERVAKPIIDFLCLFSVLLLSMLYFIVIISILTYYFQRIRFFFNVKINPPIKF